MVNNMSDELRRVSKTEHGREDAAPVLSVIMPSLNVARYIEECVESVCQQTLKDIEILCVDAGSTDGTLEKLQAIAQRDARIQIIHSDKKSYGYQMNLGLDAARGEYIGIVETDDWIEPDMFEKMYQAAKEQNADMVKCNYYWYTTSPEKESKPFENLKRCQYNQVFCPREHSEIFTTTPSIWSGIYAKEMLVKHGVRFHETPGASFQDISFHFMTCTVSQRCYLLPQCLHHYRKDNDGSSVHSKGKVFCVSDEMHYFEAYLAQKPEYLHSVLPFYFALKYEKYRWNYERLQPASQWEFLELMYEEFKKTQEKGLLHAQAFSQKDWENVCAIVKNPLRYYQKTCKIYSARPTFSDIYPEHVAISSQVEHPKISVIVPVYQVEEFIVETVNSVLNQTDANVEVVCVNDGSEDRSRELVEELAKRDHRITLVDQMNKGLSVARNTGMRHAKGEYIIFLDGDDMLGPDAVEVLYARAKQDNLDVLYYDGASFFETPELERKHSDYKTLYQYSADVPDVMTGRDLFCKMKQDRKYRTSACLAAYSKEYLNAQNLLFVEGIYHEDNLFSLQCMLKSQRVSHVKNQFLIRRVRADSIVTTKKNFMHVYGYFTCVIEMYHFAQNIGYDEELIRQVASQINNTCNEMCRAFQNVENKAECRRKFTPVELVMVERIIAQGGQSRWEEDDPALIRASMTYRIGSFFTFIPRKIRGGIRCIQENGMGYTIHRFKEKFAHKLGR